MPIGPAPLTTATSPGLILALVAACMPTATGSTMAPSAKLTLSGSLKVKAAGWTTVGRSTPWIGGVAQKRTAGSRLYMPSSVALLLGSGMPGSMQTRSPTLRLLHLAADLDDAARGLVAEHHRRAHDKLADGAVRVVVHVAAADPDRMDGDAHIVRPQLFGDLDIAESEFVFSFKDKRFHFSFLQIYR